MPPGWAHLVIKSIPRLAAGEVASLPKIAHETATRFRTAVLVDVCRSGGEGSPFLLRRVGARLSTPIRGVDTIISSATLDTQSVSLSWLERRVLAEAER